MALAPFYVLATGKIRSDEEEERRRQTGEKGTPHPQSTYLIPLPVGRGPAEYD